ncbi:hypothetical protein MCOR25_003421 [Pyricularia grisea]|nr:hypothetical protein MCOR25_003421 [Pyricularia grisea]
MMISVADIMRRLPFAASTTTRQAITYLLGISLFSISFLVFLNSSLSFVITDLIGVKNGVGDIVGTLGFADEIVALVACPAWGLISDRLGVRQVAVVGYSIIGASLVLFVQAQNVYPQLLLARILFAIGATSAATMVTAILPPLTDDADYPENESDPSTKPSHNSRDSVALSLESEVTITPERFAAQQESGVNNTSNGVTSHLSDADKGDAAKPSALAGLVGLFTGCGALVALAIFLPLPVRFGHIEGTTPAEAVTYSFYVVGAVAFCVAGFVAWGLRGIKGEEGKGWQTLLGRSPCGDENEGDRILSQAASLRRRRSQSRRAGQPSVQDRYLPYGQLLKDSVRLGFVDPQIGLGYLGGFVARASTVAISLFIPLFINTYFIRNGFCQGSPHDPSPELKKECRAAYVLASILTGVAQLFGLVCAPIFGYLASRATAKVKFNLPVVVATSFGIIGYILFARLQSPEFKNVDGRGGSPWVFLVAAMLGISQIGCIVCSLGSLGRGVLTVDLPASAHVQEEQTHASGDERAPLLAADEAEQGEITMRQSPAVSRVRLKGSIAGVYSWCGGAAILLLTKLGGFLFDKWSTGAPFYMMALFNGILLVAAVGVDAARFYKSCK